MAHREYKKTDEYKECMEKMSQEFQSATIKQSDIDENLRDVVDCVPEKVSSSFLSYHSFQSHVHNIHLIVLKIH